MNSRPLITVIIPVYNIDKYVEKCLSSVCEQTYQKLEILVIDDHSTDASGEICDCYAAVDNRIRVIHHDFNQGIAKVRNTGIQEAKGEYYLFVDGDDYIEPDLCENAIKAMQHSKADTVHWGYYCVDEEGQIVSEEVPILKEQEVIHQEEIFDQVLGTLLVSMDDLYYWFSHRESYYEAIHSKKQMASVWRFLLSAEVIKKNHLLFPNQINRGEDLIFLLQYLQCSKEIVNLKKKEYYYVQRKGSLISNNSNIENKLRLMEAMDQVVHYAPNNKQEELKDKWRGQRILITMNTARVLVKEDRFCTGYREFKRIAKHYDSIDAFQRIELKGIPFKYKMAIGMIKYRLYLLFYLCIYGMKMIHMDMAPME